MLYTYAMRMKDNWINSHLVSFIKAAYKQNGEIENRERRLVYLLTEKNIYHTHFFTLFCDKEKGKVSILKRNSQSNKIATAICLKDEEFSIRTGIAVAWAKYNHEIIPNFNNMKLREELVNGDKFLSKDSRKKYVFIGFLHQDSDSIAVVKVENTTPARLYKIKLDKVIILVD